MIVEFCSISYLFIVIFNIAIVVALSLVLRKMSSRVSYIVILSIMIFNILHHFFKFILYGVEGGYSFSLHNICSVIIVFMPFVFISRNKVLKDASFYIGLCAGFFPIVFPINYINTDLFSAGTFRYFLCHTLILLSAILPISTKLHTLSYKRIVFTPLIFLCIQTIILINNFICWKVGLLPEIGNSLASFMSRSAITNSTMIFGPPTAYSYLERILFLFTPKLFTFTFSGEIYCLPVIWMSLQILFFGTIFLFLLVMFFDFSNLKKDFLLKNRNNQVKKVN